MKKKRSHSTIQRPGHSVTTLASQPEVTAKRVHFFGFMALLCLCLYAWTLDFPLVFDDYFYLQDNTLFKEGVNLPVISEISELVKRVKAAGWDPDLAYNMVLRPVAYASFHLNHALDGFDPRWFRAVNIGIHFLNACMVTWLLSLLTSELVKRNELEGRSGQFIAKSAGLLFLVHPMAVESVTYIVQRFTSLGMTWYLACLIVYFISHQKATRGARLALGALASVLLLMGMLTKEDCFTAPVMAVFMDRLIFRTPVKRALLKALPLLIWMTIIPTLVLALSAAGNDGSVNVVDAMQLVDRKPESWGVWGYFITQLTVVVKYMGALLIPVGLCLTPQATAYTSVWQWPVLGSLALILWLFLWSVMGVLKRPTDGRRRLLMLCVIWFFATISISSSVIPLPDLAAFHRTYLASFGFFAALCCGLDWLRMKLERVLQLRRQVGGCIVGCLAFCLAIATMKHNHLWRTNISLWSDAVVQNPQSYAAWNNLGSAHYEAGDPVTALMCFERVLLIEPRYQGAQLNVSQMLLALGRWQECHDRTIGMMEKYPGLLRSMQAIYIVAAAHVALGNLDQGEGILKALLQQDPNFLPSRDLLARVNEHRRLGHTAGMHLVLDTSATAGKNEVIQEGTDGQ
jgi:protein O-mannosyl-transferase